MIVLLYELSEIKAALCVCHKFFIILSKCKVRGFRYIFWRRALFGRRHFLERIDVNHFYLLIKFQKTCIIQPFFVLLDLLQQVKIDKFNMLNESERYDRISRVRLQNSALSNHYGKVPQRNNIFFRLKRNSAILSKHRKNDEQNNEIISRSCEIQPQSLSLDKRITEQSLKHNQTQILSDDFRNLSQSKLTKQKTSQLLPKIRKSNGNIILNRDKTHKEQIQGTKIGVLSTKQILKKYELNKLSQEVKKKQFLLNHIKNLKIDDYDMDSDAEPMTKPQFVPELILVQNPSQKELIPCSSQDKLMKLLQNKLTDRDFINFNVKLFEKKDINKKRFFQRYRNILKKQRQNVENT